MRRKLDHKKRRISNRIYPIRKCKKTDCQEDFIPSDSRQIYCCEQHRIDFNNDKRKQKEAITILFLKKIKKNGAILKKILSSSYYKKHKCVNKSLLDYEDYDFNFYHKITINYSTGNEGHICFGFALELIDPINQIFTITNMFTNEL